jgi:hypothetical protein
MDTTTSVPLSVAAAAAQANVSTKTIRRWLSAGRLEASRGLDGAWLIEPSALETAMLTPGPSTDSPTLHVGHGQVQSIVQTLLDRVEQQAERIGRLDAELVSTRLQLAVAENRLLALEAPKRTPSQERPFLADSVGVSVEPTQTSTRTPQRAPWWAPWRRATS